MGEAKRHVWKRDPNGAQLQICERCRVVKGNETSEICVPAT